MPTIPKAAAGYKIRRLVKGVGNETPTGSEDIPHGIFDLAILPNGEIAGGTAHHGRVVRFEKSSGRILELLQEVPGSNASWGVDHDAAGNIYTASDVDGKVHKYAAATGAPILVGQNPLLVEGSAVVVNASGTKLYVANLFFDGGILEYDISNPGAFPVSPTVVVGPSALGVLGDYQLTLAPADVNRRAIFSMTFKSGSDTELYTTGFDFSMRKWDLSQTFPLDPDNPAHSSVISPFSFGGIAWNAQDNRIYYIDIGLPFAGISPALLMSIDPVLGFPAGLRFEALMPEDLGDFPEGIDIDDNGTLLATGIPRGAIYEYIPGTSKSAIAWRPIRRTDLTIPCDVSARKLSSGQKIVEVADMFRTVQVDGTNGQILSERGLLGYGPFVEPISIEHLSDSEVLICANLANPIVMSYDRNTELFTSLRIDLSGTVYYLMVRRLDADNAIAIAYPGDGKFVTTPGQILKLALDDPPNAAAVVLNGTDFPQPSGLAISGTTLFVSDRSLGKVYTMDSTLGPPIAPVEIISGLTSPQGLAIHPDGNLLVTEVDTGVAGSSIKKYTAAGAFIETVATGLNKGLRYPTAPPFYPPQYVARGLAVDEDGVIYTADDLSAELLRIEKTS